MHKKRLQLRSPCRSWGRFSRFPSWKRKVWLVKSWRYDSTEERTRGAHFTVSRLPGHKGPDVTGIYLASAAHGFRRLTNKAKTASRKRINIPRPSRGYFLCGRSPMLPATPHAALVRLAICIGCPTHTGISPAPFHSYIAVIPNTYAFSSA